MEEVEKEQWVCAQINAWRLGARVVGVPGRLVESSFLVGEPFWPLSLQGYNSNRTFIFHVF